MNHSWLSPAAEIRPAGAKGKGVFASKPISAGSVVTAFGGYVMDAGDFHALSPEHQIHSLQIGTGLFLACPESAEDADLFNHSCDPNLGISGSIMLIAMRDIAIDEELTFDYAMCDDDAYDEFECCCGTEGCRRKVTGNDWMLPELQERYDRYFSTYLQQRITELRSGSTSDWLP